VKKTYFSHEASARNDEKCIALRMVHGLSGYGAFWCLIERLMQESDYTSVADYNRIAFDLRCDAALIKAVVEDFGLFTFTENGERFYSESLMRRMLKVDEISARRSEVAKQKWAAIGVKDANAQGVGCKCKEIGCKCNAIAYKFTHKGRKESKGSKGRKEGNVVPTPDC